MSAQLDRLLDLSASGQYTEAEPEARRVLQEWPQCGVAFKALGLCLQQRGLDPEAVVVLERAAALAELDGGIWAALGSSLYSLGAHRRAELALRRAVALDPANCPAHNTLGLALKAIGRHAEAEASFRNAICVGPGIAEPRLNLGNVLQIRGEFAEAEHYLREAIGLSPGFHSAHNDLGVLLLEMRRVSEAVQCFRNAIALKSDFAGAHNNLGNALQRQGKPDEAGLAYRQALVPVPDPRVFSNLLFCLSHDPAIGRERLMAEHVEFGRTFEAPLKHAWPRHENEKDPERRLRVGMISGDLRAHSIPYFLEPVLEKIAERPELEIRLYSTSLVEDPTSERLRLLASGWHAVGELSDSALAERIQADGVDVLIDLSGHTSLNRLMAFARKPAPVQASWLGYPGTTGLQAMDYYLGDRNFLPWEQFESQFTEKIVHLPALGAFRSFDGAPDAGPLPALSSGRVTFGSFNRRAKIGRAEVRVWAALLRAVPGSRLLIGGLPQEPEQPELVAALLAEGVAADRLSLHGRCGMADYLKLHQSIDLCLDTFTYTGGTTTLHALWMGVPTVTIAGETAPARQGTAIMLNMGLETCVASDEADFVRKGAALAGDPTHLAELRRGMRDRFRRSIMGQPELVAIALEKALRAMWRRWCAGLEPEAFSVS